MSTKGRSRFLAMVMAAALPVMLWATPAHADPCEGRLPKEGTSFSGVVRYVGDGDGLCVGPAGQPDRWIEVRLGDFFAPELEEPGGAEAKSLLQRLTLGRPVVCRAGRRSYDRVIAHCRLGARPIGDMLRANGGIEAGRGWRR